MSEVLSTMRLQLLGTGAADHHWDKLGEPGVRGSCSSLLNGHILIDCGVTGLANLERFGIAPEAVDTVLFTHSHNDHFVPEQLAGLSPRTIYASGEILQQLSSLPAKKRELVPGMQFQTGEFDVTALPANHLTNIPGEKSYHFCFESTAGNLLYALDGSSMLKEAFQLIRGIRLDWLVLDCTMADSGNWRIFEHSDIAMNRHLLQTLRNENMVDAGTRVILNHLARTLWPETEEECLAKVAGDNFELAHDGMVLIRESFHP